jgi:hypothetical protein
LPPLDALDTLELSDSSARGLSRRFAWTAQRRRPRTVKVADTAVGLGAPARFSAGGEDQVIGADALRDATGRHDDLGAAERAFEQERQHPSSSVALPAKGLYGSRRHEPVALRVSGPFQSQQPPGPSVVRDWRYRSIFSRAVSIRSRSRRRPR